MQIVHIVPGSGGSFYCGNCLRDSKYMAGLKQAGAGVVKVPMYLPLFADERDLDDVPVFYGAVNLYLGHNIPAFRKAPKWIKNMLDSGPVLKLAADMAGSTNPKGLEDMTISMLLGESGEQKKELDHLVEWIGNHCEADVVHLSNALLLGLAKRIKEKLDVIVVCTLQDEDVWVNAMDEEFKKRTWALMKERAMDVDAFFAVSDYYAGEMQPLLNISDDKLFTRHIMIDAEDYQYIGTEEKPLNIGYISRMNECNGLELLIDAFILLKRSPRWKDVKLVLTGGSTGDDNKFLYSMKKKIRQAGIVESIEFHKDFEGEGRDEFFRKVSAISVPVLEGEAFGLYLLESMASGIPVVQPEVGAFPEIISKAGGGITYAPNRPDVLAKTLESLLNDREKLSALSKTGRAGVEEHFNIHRQAQETLALYHKIIRKETGDSDAA
ncbi:MAG: glycosyltransferase family 4 protein [Cytophagales bacterium]|nr:glycosyltransferase family 4 protein [Cytophagales bacterium]